jgi:inner membrane protein
LEPITHFLTGACLARAGFNRKSALATATMTLAAEAPDLDVFWGFKGPVLGFAHHRGFTHSFLGLFLTAAVVTAFMHLIWLLRGKRTNVPGLEPRWGLLFIFAYVAGLTHILLDFTNNYGVRPFWPLWEKWYSWDIVFIFEPALYIFLIGALIIPGLFFWHEPPPRGRKAAVVGLLCVAALWAFRDHEHRHAVQAIKQQRFQSAAPIRVSVYPYFWSLTHWYAVAETPDFFATTDINSRTGTLDLSQLEFLPKPPETPATLAAKRTYLGRGYLDWAQYPYVTEAQDGENVAVHFKDLRFDYPSLRGRITLSCTVELDRNLRVVAEKFGHREQSPPLD